MKYDGTYLIVKLYAETKSIDKLYTTSRRGCGYYSDLMHAYNII